MHNAGSSRPGDAADKLPSGPGDTGWQARKSAATRGQIIRAAIRCIVELSYAGTTIVRIAEMAGLSRGATLHHFPSKKDVIKAVVAHLHEKRLQAFRNSVQSIPAGADRVRLALESYWRHVNHPVYIAIFELSVAARTDEELRDILLPALREFDREWHATAREAFPEWQSDPEAFNLALNLTQQVLEGMAICPIIHAREPDTEALLGFLEDTLKRLRPDPGARR